MNQTVENFNPTAMDIEPYGSNNIVMKRKRFHDSMNCDHNDNDQDEYESSQRLSSRKNRKRKRKGNKGRELVRFDPSDSFIANRYGNKGRGFNNNATSWFESDVRSVYGSESDYTSPPPSNKIVIPISCKDEEDNEEEMFNPFDPVFETDLWGEWNKQNNADIFGFAKKTKKSHHIRFDDWDEPNLPSKRFKKSKPEPPKKISDFPPLPPPLTLFPPLDGKNGPSFLDIILGGLPSGLIPITTKSFSDPPASKKQKTNGGKKDDKKAIECNNPLCNHKTLEEDPTPAQQINIQEIRTIDDLITLGKAFHCKKQTTYNCLNLRLMNNLVVPLTELKDMIGLGNVKNRIVDQILFFLQGFNTMARCNNCQDCTYDLPCVQTNTEMLHTVITGPPGVGKTCLARIIGKVYKAMGILSKGEFHEVARSDFVAKYLGQTAIKTQELVKKCKGGVMFIDEAYSLGHKEKRDSFAKEALDTLNKNLSDEKDLLCIIAGYKKELDECFFSMNDGLKRRFSFRYDIESYDYNELLDIFKLKVEKEGWGFDLNPEEPAKYDDISLINMFRKHKEFFPYCGGDIETLFLQCKITHGRRMPPEGSKKSLSMGDLEKGFKEFVKHRKYDEGKKKKKDGSGDKPRPNMYNIK